jgi:hypothetical protein
MAADRVRSGLGIAQAIYHDTAAEYPAAIRLVCVGFAIMLLLRYDGSCS